MESGDIMEQTGTTFNNRDDMLSNSYRDNIPHFKEESIVTLDYYMDYNIAHENKQQQIKPVAVCIVVPTYNEAQNIPKLLNALYSKEQQLNYDVENITMNVLVVDDNSPDGTADVVKSYQQKNSHIYLLSRSEKNGLGAAYIAGMQHAMKLLNPDIIFEMDGDLSHGPEYVLPMIHKINDGADFVIGSRYVKGGSIPENWGMKRKLISRSANLYAKTILRIKDVNDCTGGFRAIRTSALKKIDLNSLKTKGYAFQISLLEEMRRNDVIMREVPIAFKDRTNGTSKMRMKDILEEGMFVLKASLQNIFSPKRVLNNTQNALAQDKESWLLNRNIENTLEPTPATELSRGQYEFSQAFGLEEPLDV
jgi:glycosyltransferase involved in cell wall biosynthesis